MKSAPAILTVIVATLSIPAFADGTITDVPGIKVGSVTLTEKPTGCTVILAEGAMGANGKPEGATPGVSQRGGAPGTRETDLMDPVNMVDKVNAIVLSGGSAYGLEAASGTMKWLEEQNIGWPVGNAGVVPIVGSAILFDLPFDGKPKIRPGADCGYKAAAAASGNPVAMGTVGAGAGATVGKAGGPGRRPMKGGLGSASIKLPNGLVVGAIVAVNSVGDIVDPYTGKVVAGAINPDDTFADVRLLLRSGGIMQPRTRAGENTTIGLVATNAKMTKAQVTKMAQMADDGFSRAINPAHTMGDGDTVFALATGKWDGEANPTLIGALAAEAMADALLAAVREATAAGGVKAIRDLKPPAVR
ncbi:MAG: P1 family peptidase [Vicinamibacteria bacterium]|jgi:L-aminopeptidase/D-esterase-like protein|nr:P1 family peptidase [Vicinamibacteria bacterium]